jgi:NitT/TauT family transport system ATP-binding protein
MEPMLELRNVGYTYHTTAGETVALTDISFSVHSGEFLSIVGPSGCGKSTLLNIIAGLLPPDSGTCLIHGIPREEAESSIGYMLQKDHLLEWRTIYRNITLGLEIQKKMTEEAKSRINAMLDTYGLSDFRNAYPRQLSGGMRQRAALIRTLALSPEILLLDEPFSALDYQTRLRVSDDIGKIIQEQGITAILVTHDLSEAISMADRVLVLSARPGEVQAIYDIHLTIDNRTPRNSRNAPEFREYFNAIWKEVDHESSESTHN